MIHKFVWVGMCAVALALAGCGDDKDDGEETGSDDTSEPTGGTTDVGTWSLSELTGACEPAEAVGSFEVAHWSDFGGYATVTGDVATAVVPNSILFLQPESQDGCFLWQRLNPFCDPICEPLEVCTHDQECEPYPSQIGLGTVTVGGLLEPVEMEPDASNYYYNTTVPFPLFEPGAMVWVQTTGGDLDPFMLRGIGVAGLEVQDTEWIVESGEDLEVTWTAGSGEARIYLAINVDQHGVSPTTMFCDVDDDGSHVIPAAILDALLQYGVSGFATGTMRRRTVDKIDLDPGCVDFKVFSHFPADVRVEGHTPCFSDGDCPKGQRCDVPINTCVDK